MADPEKTLAKEAARKIKSLSVAHNAQIEQIYRDFKTQVEALKREASANSLTHSSADLHSQTETNR